MNDGTYLKLGGQFHRVESESGYWVATYETTLDSVSENAFVGVWTDDSGKVWIDNTHFFTSKQTALDFGEYWKQLAIWDCANNAVIEIVPQNADKKQLDTASAIA